MTDSVPPKPAALDETLGDRLAKSLKYAGLTHTDMAAYLEVHRVTIGSWVQNRAKPNPANMRLWAGRTGVPYQWLRDGDWPEGENPASAQVQPTPQRVQ